MGTSSRHLRAGARDLVRARGLHRGWILRRPGLRDGYMLRAIRMNDCQDETCTLLCAGDASRESYGEFVDLLNAQSKLCERTVRLSP